MYVFMLCQISYSLTSSDTVCGASIDLYIAGYLVSVYLTYHDHTGLECHEGK